MIGFNKVTLGDVLTFQRGFDITKAQQEEGDVPIISSSGVTSYHNQWKVKGPGVIIGRKGTLGTVHYTPTHYWPHDTTLWVKDFKGNTPKFIYYFLKTLHLENFDAGASNPTLNRNHLHKLRVIFPEPYLQKKIAAIISAYDDLIENNKRRIALLEKMAEEIYREWFVRMRFPGHEKVKFEKGVPVNWKTTKLGNIANLTMGQSPKSEFYNEIGEGLPFNQGVGTYGERFPRKATYCTSTGRKAKKGDILFSVRAPVGRLNIADCEMIIGRGLASIRHKDNLNSYLFYLLRTSFSNEDIIGNGAIFNSVGKDELSGFNILQPDRKLMARFNDIASNIDMEIALLFEALERLASSRNLLLSRLISGKLAVENLDIRFPPGMLDEDDESVSVPPAVAGG